MGSAERDKNLPIPFFSIFTKNTSCNLNFYYALGQHWIKGKSKSEEWIALTFLISSKLSLTLELKLS